MSSHVHSAHCACAHSSVPKSGFVSLLPALSCALCPACLSLWKPLLAVGGVALMLDETQHAWLLALALTIALGFGLREAVRTREWRPFWPTLAGAALLVFAHFAEVEALEWFGTFVMFLSMPVRMWLRRAVHA
ncbi:MAG: MerC family mercury resistance protein [Archangium sp.]